MASRLYICSRGGAWHRSSHRLYSKRSFRGVPLLLLWHASSRDVTPRHTMTRQFYSATSVRWRPSDSYNQQLADASIINEKCLCIVVSGNGGVYGVKLVRTTKKWQHIKNTKTKLYWFIIWKITNSVLLYLKFRGKFPSGIFVKWFVFQESVAYLEASLEHGWNSEKFGKLKKGRNTICRSIQWIVLSKELDPRRHGGSVRECDSTGMDLASASRALRHHEGRESHDPR